MAVAKIKKKVGALPVGFSGKIYDIPFKIINQYDIYNNVSSIAEDKNNGSTIVVYNGLSAENKANQFVSYIENNTKYKKNEIDLLDLKRKLKTFSNLMTKEVKQFNNGNKKTIKKQPLIILLPKKNKKIIVKKIPVKTNKQKGNSNLLRDSKLQALRPGKRISNEGNIYYEYRANRSDKGKLLGIKNFNTTINFDDIQKDLDSTIKKINQFENYILNFNLALKNKKNITLNAQIKKVIPKLKKYILELKKHKTELKKLL